MHCKTNIIYLNTSYDGVPGECVLECVCVWVVQGAVRCGCDNACLQ